MKRLLGLTLAGTLALLALHLITFWHAGRQAVDVASPHSPPLVEAGPATGPAAAPPTQQAAKTRPGSETPPPAEAPSSIPEEDLAIRRAEAEISAIITNRGIADSEVARRLLALAQAVATPMDQRVAALENGLMIADDAHYALVRPLLENPALEPKLARLLLRDLHQRGDAVKLPALLALLLQEGHPLHEDARNTLAFLLAADHGRNRAAWRTAVDAHLRAARP